MLDIFLIKLLDCLILLLDCLIEITLQEAFQLSGGRDMETGYFKTLQAVLESGSFSRAASDLNITPLAVAQRLRFMEEPYGMPSIAPG